MGNLIPENSAKKIDSLGRITLPKGLRDRMYLKNDDEMEIFTALLDGRQCICLSKPIDETEKIAAAIDLLAANGYSVRRTGAAQDDVLLNDMRVLVNNFYKVIEVNYLEDSYYEVKVNEDKVVYNGLMNWVNKFGAVGVHEEDRDRFYKFFEIEEKKRVFYRRRIDDSWRWVCMENYHIDDDNSLLVVRDVENYIRDYREQVN